MRSLYKIVNYMQKINNTCPIILRNGSWVNSDECMSFFTQYEISEFRQCFNFDTKAQEAETKTTDYQMMLQDDYSGYEYPCSNNSTINSLFLREYYMEILINLYDKTHTTVSDKLDVINLIRKYNFEELLCFISDIFDSASKGYDLDFSDSIIFVIGNLDEAYTIAFNSDPDMSPDQFNKITQKITLVDIKKSLQKRFRNEQIARLGNIHMIYPAFSSKSFMDIIRLTLKRYGDDVKKLIGYDVEFADSIVKFIYSESVFPTHGTRPIFSSIHEIVKSKLPLIMREIYEKNISCNYIEYVYHLHKTVINLYDEKHNLVDSLKYEERTRINNLREGKGDDEQCVVAVHESGHFVVYAALMHKIPEKLCSKTASSNTGGFLMEDFDDVHKLQTFDALIKEIKICLGGYCAEKLTFGNIHMSIGASSDLRKATVIASKLVRDYGMYNPYVTTYSVSQDINEEGHILMPEHRDSENEYITKLLNRCISEVYELFSSECWKGMLKESSQYLSVNSHMPKKKMKEIFNKIDKSCYVDVMDKGYYRQKINQL